MPIIEAIGVSKHFYHSHSLLDRLRDRKHAVRAVDDVSLIVEKGRTMGLIGASGCGKTTLARVLLRLLPATSGTVRFEGRDVFRMNGSELKSFRRQVQIMFQDSAGAIDPRYDARRCVEEPLLIHDIDGGHKREMLDEALSLVRFPRTLLARKPSELSGGQRQRVNLARSLVLKPKLLVLDEPFAGLDASVKAQILTLLMDLKLSLGLTYLLISHDLETTHYASDRIAVMYMGRILEVFDAGAVESARHPYTLDLLAKRPAQIQPEHGPPGHTRHLWETPSEGCCYAPSCGHSLMKCLTDQPTLASIGEDHLVACHVVQDANFVLRSL